MVFGSGYDFTVSGNQQAGGIYEYSIFDLADFCGISELGYLEIKLIGR